MAITCPVDFDVGDLRERVQAVYTRVAEDPAGDFDFHRGPRYAAEVLGYDPAELAALPDRATARFAGVGNPLAIGPVVPGQAVRSAPFTSRRESPPDLSASNMPRLEKSRRRKENDT